MFILLAVMPIIGTLMLLIANAHSLVGDPLDVIDNILEKDGIYGIVGEVQKLLFIFALSVILLGVFAAAYEVIREIQIYKRERMASLGIVPYLGSKVALLFGFGMVQVLTILAVVSIKVHFPGKGIFLPAYFEIYITLLLALMAGVSIGLFISTLVKSDSVVIYLILIVLFLQIIFSGVLFDLPGAAKPLAYLTPTRWAMEGLGSTVNMEELNDLGKTYIKKIDIQGQSTEINSTIASKMEFSINYAHTAIHLIGTWFILLLFICAFIGLSGYMLKRKDI